MTEASIADLDELILKCKAAQARSFISEAVDSYRAGAFRSSIVATWVALTYDFIDKLRQLDLTGDAQAKQYLSDFENIRAKNDIGAALRFEREILTRARNLELISELEQKDLERLREDRDRCAHPSMNAADEAYQPPPELARLHLWNAVNHLLQQSPVQGKAALNRLLSEVGSNYFPKNVEKALEHFRQGPLQRARPSLIRNFVIILLKRCVATGTGILERGRYITALSAVLKMHRGTTEQVLAESTNDIVRLIPDDSLWKLIELLYLVPDARRFIKADTKNRLITFVESGPDEELPLFLCDALDIGGDLQLAALRRLKLTPKHSLVALIGLLGPRQEYAERALELYSQVTNYEDANEAAKQLIEPMFDLFDLDHLKRLRDATTTNSQIAGSYGWSDIKKKLIDRGIELK